VEALILGFKLVETVTPHFQCVESVGEATEGLVAGVRAALLYIVFWNALCEVVEGWFAGRCIHGNLLIP